MFKVGDKVIITNKQAKNYGRLGVVASACYWQSNIRVGESRAKLYSNSSLRLATKEDLDKINEGVSNMGISGKYEVAMVRPKRNAGTKTYAFALFDSTIKDGDNVLCNCENGYMVGEVVKVVSRDSYTEHTVTNEIICKVDFTAFESRVKDRERKALLKKRMDELLRDSQELILYQAIAEKVPDMAAMLKEYNELEGV